MKSKGGGERKLLSSMPSSNEKTAVIKVWGLRFNCPSIVVTEWLNHNNVKNEGRSDYVYENKWKSTKCTPINPGSYTKMHHSLNSQAAIDRLFGQKCTNYSISRDEGSSRLLSSRVGSVILIRFTSC
jgi:hypothetical protein